MKIDIHNSKKKLLSKIGYIKSSNKFSKRNKKYLLDFVDYCIADGLVGSRTLNYLQTLVRITKALNKDLKRVKKKDLIKFLKMIEESNYSEHTKQSYKVTLKKFYKWLLCPDGDQYDQPLLVRWIKTGIKSSRRRLAEELLSEEEVNKIIESCDNIRDKAFISTLYESGCRPAELLTLKIKDITFDENGAILNVFGKTGGRLIRIVFSSPYLSSWLNLHTHRDPEEFVWLQIRGKEKGKMLTYAAMRKLIKKTFLKAGVNKKPQAYLFRRSRATFLARHLSDFQLKSFMGWTASSRAAASYVFLSNRDNDNGILAIYNKQKQNNDGTILTPKQCNRCKQTNPPGIKFCGFCGAPLNLITSIESDERKQRFNKKMDILMADSEVEDFLKRKVEQMELNKSQ